MHQDRPIGSRVFYQPHEGLGAGVRHGEQAVQQLLVRSTARWVVGSEQPIVTALEIVGKGGVVLRVCGDGVRRHCCCCCCCMGSARCGTGSRWCCRHRSYKQTTDSCVGCCLPFFVRSSCFFFAFCATRCSSFLLTHRDSNNTGDCAGICRLAESVCLVESCVFYYALWSAKHVGLTPDRRETS